MMDKLTPRERDVLQLYSEGVETKKIADRLGISNETLRTYRKNILRKTGFRSITQVVAMAKLIEPAEPQTPDLGFVPKGINL